MNEIPEIRNPIDTGKVLGDDITMDVYRRQSVARGHPEFIMGRSELDDFNTCPMKWRNGFESKQSGATEWGTAFDSLVLTPDRFASDFAICPKEYPDSKTGKLKPWNFNATFCDEWRTAQADKSILKAHTAEEVTAARDVLMQDAAAARLLACSKRQVMVVAEYLDKETGIVVPLKCLVDLAPHPHSTEFGNCLADLKTATCAAHFVWTRDVQKYRYHWQAALYLDCWTAATGEDRNTFRHLIVESDPPYQTARRIMSQDFVMLGRLGYLGALKRYAACLKSGVWPDYETEPEIVIDGWTLTQPEAWMAAKE